MSYESRESIITEIKLCLENDGDLYRSCRRPYEVSLLKKLAVKNRYCHSLAVQGWLRIVTNYLKIYAKEWDLVWAGILSPQERLDLANQLASEFLELAQSGEYDGTQLTTKKEFNSKEIRI